MCASPNSRRTTAEIDFGESSSAGFNVGDRSIHQYWHLFSSNVRGVLLAPQRRPDSGNVAWTWREPADNPPLTAPELAEVRLRLSNANRLLTGGKRLIDDGPVTGNLDRQVREKAGAMVAQLAAMSDAALSGFVGRTETGPMIHSWGAAKPAQPHYPGTSEGTVSGTVFLGAERAAGLAVVLENSSGALVARTNSGAAGAFSFQNVAPGNYHVRVTGRADFPAGGLAVTMERDSIAGLELRDRTATADGASTSGDTAASAPRRKRRALAWLALLALLLLGIGACVWRSVRPPAEIAADHAKPSGWQSASGQAATPTGHPSPADVRPVGKDGSWSALTPVASVPDTSRDLQPAKPRLPASTPASPKTPSAIDNPPTDSPATPETATPTDAAAQPKKTSRAASSEKKSPGSAATPGKNKTDRAPKDASPSTDNQPSATEPTGPEEPVDSTATPAAKSTAKSSAKAKTKSHPATTPASPSPASDAENEVPPPSETSVPSAAPASSPPAAAASRPGHPGAAKNQPSSAANSTASANDAAAPSDSPESSAPGAAADSPPSHAATQTPSSSKTSAAANANAATAAPAAAEAAPPGNDVNSADQTPSATAPAQKNPPSKPAAAKRPPAPAATNSPPPSAAASPDDSPAENPPPASATAAKTPAKPPAPAAATKAASPPPEANAPTPVPAADASVALPESASPAAESNSPAKPKAPQKKPTPATKTPDAPSDESPASPDVPNSSPLAPAILSSTAAARDELIPLAHVSSSGWKPRLVQDLILPTQPMPATEDESVDTLREKLRREQKAKIPAAFRQPVITSGFTVEFPPEKSFGPPQWHTPGGARPAGATVQNDCAEISWPGANPAGSLDLILSYPDGREIARVRTDADGIAYLEATAPVRGWYWVGIADPPIADAAVSPPQNAPRLDWQLLSGAPVPASWRQRSAWPGGKGHRLELPLGSGSADKRPYSLALVDPLTGWALVSEIRVR